MPFLKCEFLWFPHVLTRGYWVAAALASLLTGCGPQAREDRRSEAAVAKEPQTEVAKVPEGSVTAVILERYSCAQWCDTYQITLNAQGLARLEAVDPEDALPTRDTILPTARVRDLFGRAAKLSLLPAGKMSAPEDARCSERLWQSSSHPHIEGLAFRVERSEDTSGIELGDCSRFPGAGRVRSLAADLEKAAANGAGHWFFELRKAASDTFEARMDRRLEERRKR